MQSLDTLHRKWPALLVAALLSACGGGGGSSTPDSQPPVNTPVSTCVTSPAGLPTATGNTAVDGFNWFNYRRAGIGLGKLSCNQLLNQAATGHSNYLNLNHVRLNDTISHEQVSGYPGFTGTTLGDRLANAGYVLSGNYAYGEVISAAGDTSGFYHAEELITAIYHRFVIFEPMFAEMGTGASTRSDGYTYFTADMAITRGWGPGLGVGKFVVYPADRQVSVPTSFDSDTESPDPVPNQNTVGYPVSVHADIAGGGITVSSFTIHPLGGGNLATRLLTSATDQHTQSHEAAIIPLSPLSPNTTYYVSFTGTVDNMPVSKDWAFITK